MAKSRQDEVISDLTRCPICFDVYTDPRSLPCLHTFCRRCLDQLLCLESSNSVAKCAVCRKPAPIPDDGVDGFPHNFTIQTLIGARGTSASTEDILNEDSGADTSRAVSNLFSGLDGQPIAGLALLGDKLCVLRCQLNEQIEVYSAVDYSLQEPRRSLSVVLGLVDLTSADVHRCVYISDTCNRCVHWMKFDDDDDDWRADPGRASGQWELDAEPWCVSSTENGNVLVACNRERKLVELCGRDGNVVREIELDFQIFDPCHAIQLSDERFVVCHSRDSRDGRCPISVVDADGKLVMSINRHIHQKDSDYGYSCTAPKHLAVDQVTGKILLANIVHGSIIEFDSNGISGFKRCDDGRIVIRCTDGWEPHRIFIDRERRRLFVAENWLNCAGRGIKLGRLRVVEGV